uniref:HicA toxin of toxin-antitoxin n=1 Tax=Candidatus Kentrum sp. MB TaxID=2138164 RepID=A0A450XCI9_9GAMM|nr:MAG: HicA toxin of toxin-antitoxin [Candidatus Kentron sp. MB]VFK31255.1 MAG: HicA toxin of toxin-antitoxin [Candidatus Kentron sp. MB]VFK75419.1 MAG: HicA toxin of toxin-antitoxin [Candidatus Kentron sp. MB]
MAQTLYPGLEAILRAHGCELIRQGKGSHEIWRSPLSNKHFSVPVTIKTKPTANAILRQAGIDQKI